MRWLTICQSNPKSFTHMMNTHWLTWKSKVHSSLLFGSGSMWFWYYLKTYKFCLKGMVSLHLVYTPILHFCWKLKKHHLWGSVVRNWQSKSYWQVHCKSNFLTCCDRSKVTSHKKERLHAFETSEKIDVLIKSINLYISGWVCRITKDEHILCKKVVSNYLKVKIYINDNNNKQSTNPPYKAALGEEGHLICEGLADINISTPCHSYHLPTTILYSF